MERDCADSRTRLLFQSDLDPGQLMRREISRPTSCSKMKRERKGKKTYRNFGGWQVDRRD